MKIDDLTDSTMITSCEERLMFSLFALQFGATPIVCTFEQAYGTKDHTKLTDAIERLASHFGVTEEAINDLLETYGMY